jgi:hypothetical protein
VYFCIASLLGCKFALPFATPLGAQISYAQYPAGTIFAFASLCWTESMLSSSLLHKLYLIEGANSIDEVLICST